MHFDQNLGLAVVPGPSKNNRPKEMKQYIAIQKKCPGSK